MYSRFLLIVPAFLLGSCLLWLGCGKKSTPEASGKKDSSVTEVEKTDAGNKDVPAPEPGKISREGDKSLTTLGVKAPLDRDIEWTAYYITPVKQTGADKGRSVSFTGLDGKKTSVQLTGTSFIEAEMEAVAVGIDKQGRKRFAYRKAEGVWKELPEGSMGMGNRLNPLVPFRHVAADNSLYPYGSMVFVPVAVGVKFGDAKPMDGYFWVADSGGRIKGNHIDLFVGEEDVYQDFVSRNHPRHHPTVIQKLPAAAKGFDPRKADQLGKLLVATGKLEGAKQDDKAAVNEALITYQKSVSYIPESEYGNPTSATTIWFLTQLGLQYKQDQEKTAESKKEEEAPTEKK